MNSKETLTNRQITGILAGLLLIFGTGLWIMISGPTEQLTAARLWFSDGLKWIKTILLLAIVVWWEQNRLQSVGVQAPSWKDWALVPVITIGILLAQKFIGAPLLEAYGATADLSTLTFIQDLPVYQKVSIVLTAGITEELMYRGYTIERIETLTGSTTLSVVFTTLLFVGVHLPAWGLATGIQQALTTLILAMAYVWRRNLVVPIVVHILIDSIGIFLAAG